MTSTITHPSLGSVHGKQGNGVTQFQGIKYGSLKDRFSASEVLTNYSNPNGIDATKIGPLVASPPQGIDMEFSFIQRSLPTPELQFSDLEGLNLNITVPAGTSGSRLTKLPVFVYVHGGGFGIGSASWPQFGHARIVKQSVESGIPIIGVGINYRLGVPGFLTSEELRRAGYAANNGLYDQITAFKWINRNIEGFGGDPENVTCIGESAGGASGFFLLQAKEPLFKRMISMGGTPFLSKPFSNDLTEAMYSSVIESLSLDKLSSPDRVKALLEMPIDDILAKVPPTTVLSPSVDDQLISAVLSFEGLRTGKQMELLRGSKWCESLLIGDCQFDGMIFAHSVLPRKRLMVKSFPESVSRTLSSIPGAAPALLSAYSITPNSTADEVFTSVLHFANDIVFYAPTLAISAAWSGSFIYRFNQGNPWDGAYVGHATHILDAAFLFQNYSEYMDEKCQKVAREYADSVLKFISGKKPWEGVEKVVGKGEMNFGDAHEVEMGRRQTIVKLGEQFGFDGLLLAWFAFLGEN